MKYFLIHGYGKSLDIREKIIPSNLGFYIFDKEIKNKEAYVFNWAIDNSKNFLTKINLLSQLKLYYKERDIIMINIGKKNYLMRLINIIQN